MVADTERIYTGGWRRLVNGAASTTGSIHDDAVARSLGFAGGFVPGSTVGQAAMPAIVDRFGARWFEGGWYAFKFVSPVYTHEDVREVAEPGEDGQITIKVENRAGRAACLGGAGLGLTPPWSTTPADEPEGEPVLPELELGRTYEMDFTTTRADVIAMLDAAGDETPWYVDASPWGGPIMPPERLMGVALQQTLIARNTPPSVRPPGIWAEHALVIERPLLLDAPYRMVQRIVRRGAPAARPFSAMTWISVTRTARGWRWGGTR